jgi:hypothetical protein
MTAFLLIETQCGAMSDRFLTDALTLTRTGQQVTVLLVADAVTAAVRGTNTLVPELVSAGAHLWADEFTLVQRALRAAPLESGVTVQDIARVADIVVADDVTVVWH